jgi:hypothetical protein
LDPANRFHTPGTLALERVDYAIGLVVLSALALYHYADVNWVRFAAAFAWIDLLGYLPGLVWYKRSGPERPRTPAVYPVLYNLTHSFSANALVVLAWWWIGGGLEWAMLAGPIHLLGDRSLFGNIYKTLGTPFEPEPDPLFERFTLEFDAGRR